MAKSLNQYPFCGEFIRFSKKADLCMSQMLLELCHGSLAHGQETGTVGDVALVDQLDFNL